MENFDAKHVDVILGHNVEYRSSMLRLPILVLECSKGGLPGEGCQSLRGRKFGVLRGEKLMKLPEVLLGESRKFCAYGPG